MLLLDHRLYPHFPLFLFVGHCFLAKMCFGATQFATLQGPIDHIEAGNELWIAYTRKSFTIGYAHLHHHEVEIKEEMTLSQWEGKSPRHHIANPHRSDMLALVLRRKWKFKVPDGEGNEQGNSKTKTDRDYTYMAVLIEMRQEKGSASDSAQLRRIYRDRPTLRYADSSSAKKYYSRHHFIETGHMLLLDLELSADNLKFIYASSTLARLPQEVAIKGSFVYPTLNALEHGTSFELWQGGSKRQTLHQPFAAWRSILFHFAIPVKEDNGGVRIKRYNRLAELSATGNSTTWTAYHSNADPLTGVDHQDPQTPIVIASPTLGKFEGKPASAIAVVWESKFRTALRPYAPFIVIRRGPYGSAPSINPVYPMRWPMAEFYVRINESGHELRINSENENMLNFLSEYSNEANRSSNLAGTIRGPFTLEWTTGVELPIKWMVSGEEASPPQYARFHRFQPNRVERDPECWENGPQDEKRLDNIKLEKGQLEYNVLLRWIDAPLPEYSPISDTGESGVGKRGYNSFVTNARKMLKKKEQKDPNTMGGSFRQCGISLIRIKRESSEEIEGGQRKTEWTVEHLHVFRDRPTDIGNMESPSKHYFATHLVARSLGTQEGSDTAGPPAYAKAADVGSDHAELNAINERAIFSDRRVYLLEEVKKETRNFLHGKSFAAEGMDLPTAPTAPPQFQVFEPFLKHTEGLFASYSMPPEVSGLNDTSMVVFSPSSTYAIRFILPPGTEAWGVTEEHDESSGRPVIRVMVSLEEETLRPLVRLIVSDRTAEELGAATKEWDIDTTRANGTYMAWRYRGKTVLTLVYLNQGFMQHGDVHHHRVLIRRQTFSRNPQQSYYVQTPEGFEMLIVDKDWVPLKNDAFLDAYLEDSVNLSAFQTLSAQDSREENRQFDYIM